VADPASERVFVLTGGRTVLEVGLDRMRVRRHRLHLGFEAAEEHGVPMPVAAAAQQVVQALMGFGYDDMVPARPGS
jgi:hypothetical protein